MCVKCQPRLANAVLSETLLSAPALTPFSQRPAHRHYTNSCLAWYTFMNPLSFSVIQVCKMEQSTKLKQGQVVDKFCITKYSFWVLKIQYNYFFLQYNIILTSISIFCNLVTFEHSLISAILGKSWNDSEITCLNSGETTATTCIYVNINRVKPL